VSLPYVHVVWLVCAAVGSLSVFYLWYRYDPKTVRARGLFFSLGIFIFLIFMPETFKHAELLLSVPLVFLGLDLSFVKNGWASSKKMRILMVFIFLLLSGFFSPDIFSGELVGKMQHWSLPFFAVLGLAWANLREALREAQK